MCLRGSLPFSNYCVSSLAAGFRFHLYSMCIPLPWNFNIGCCANEKPLRWIAHRRVRFFTFTFVSTLVLGAGGELIESNSSFGKYCDPGDSWVYLLSNTGAIQWHSLLDSPGRPWAAKSAHMDREFLFRTGWYPAGPLGGWVEFVLDSKAEPLGCYVAMHCRYCTETKTLGKHLNSSAGNFSAWRPLTVHVWEIALQLRPQAVSYTMFYWLCMLWQDCSPFRPGTVFMSTQWRTWLVADHDWSNPLPQAAPWWCIHELTHAAF